MTETAKIAEMFNDMSEEYDEIGDLWNSWLYSRLHFIIARNIVNEISPNAVLDVGCGTGFQSYLHASAGSSVVGIDIAEKLVKAAKDKMLYFNPKNKIILFPEYFDFVKVYNDRIDSIIKNNNKKIYQLPIFAVADMRYLPFRSKSFDHVNCCGSTLSLIEDHQLALSEISRVLKPGGTFLLEVVSRWNLELLWSIIDAILGGKSNYDSSISEALGGIFIPPRKYIDVDCPLGYPEKSVNMRIKLFTLKGLEAELSELQLECVKKWSIHSITNMIPITYLDRCNPGDIFKKFFNFLAYIEENIPIYIPGCRIVMLYRKKL